MSIIDRFFLDFMRELGRKIHALKFNKCGCLLYENPLKIANLFIKGTYMFSLQCPL
jgi:hypothetical protein